MRSALAAVFALLLALALAPAAGADAAPVCSGVATQDARDPACGLLLPTGAHRVTWAGRSTPVAGAFEGERLAFTGVPPASDARPINFVTVWQVDAGAWRGWAVGGTPSASPLLTLEPGGTYAVVTSADLAWSFGPTAERSLLEHARVVSFYGRPGVPEMGALGAYPTAAAASQAVAEVAARYAPLSGDRRVIPALHLIVDAAHEDPGNDGTYLGRMPLSAIQPYVDATRDAGQLLFLDLQVGWSDPLVDVQRLESVLREPHVHVALDPEFATKGKGEPPGEAIGYLTGTQVYAVQHYLAGLSRAANIPAKLLVVHQFRYDMLRETADIVPVDGADLVIDMDGFGIPEQKLGGYTVFARASYAEYAGFKLFYRWDTPLLTPEQVMAMPHPPDYVIYQ